MIGKTFGPYRIEAQLGAGGMGVVYRAQDTRLGRDVALKLLGERFLNDPDARRRLLNEARAASALNHPSICTIYDVGEAEGQSFIAMEHVPGQPLSELIPESGLPSETAIRYGAQIAAALAHAHERGIVHRDLKSANVVITPEGQAKVLDFGLAGRLRQEELAEVTRSVKSLQTAREVAGTVPYMAPEVLRGEPGDARSDIWALGVVLYEMAGGALPFRGRTGYELTSAILREPLPPLPASVPASVRAVIQRCLAKESGQRFQQAVEVRAALEALSSDVAIPAVAPVAVKPWWRRQIIYWAAAALVLVGLGIWKGPFVLSIGRTETGPRLSTGGKPSANKEATEYFERGLLLMKTGFDLPRSRQIFEHALELDPKFAEARAWYGFTDMLMVDSGTSNDSSWLYKSEAELRQALADDPNCGNVHSALAGLYFYQNRLELVPEEVSRGRAINPKNPDLDVELGAYYMFRGELDKAVALATTMVERDPLFWVAYGVRADLRRQQGDLAGARQDIQKAIDQDPQNFPANRFLVRILLDGHKTQEARQVLEKMKPSYGQNFIFRLSWAELLALEGRHKEARREMDGELLKFFTINPYYTADAADVFAQIGDTQQALEWLERAVEKGDERMEWFQRDPFLENIRKEPRFKQILDSIAFRRQQRGR